MSPIRPRALLLVPRLTPALLLLLLWGALGSCELENPQVGLTTDDLITLSLSDSVLLADGVSVLTLTATLGPAASANQEVTFATEAGRFERAEGDGSTLSLRTSGRSVQAVLVSGTEVAPRVNVSASVSGTEANEPFVYTATRVVSFARALPDEARLTLGQRSLTALPERSTSLTVQLLRAQGRVSGGTRVFFAAAPAPGDSVRVVVEPFAFADTDQVSTTVTNLDTIPGTALLRAWVLAPEGDTAVQAQVALPVE